MGKTELTNRFEKFAAGQWEALFQAAVDATRVPVEMTEAKRAKAAYQKVRLGEVSRARQCLASSERFSPKVMIKHSGNSKTDVHRKFPGQC